MTAKIHIVFGACGEYSDHREWAVAAYHGQAAAQAHVERAGARFRELIQKHRNYYSIPRGANDHDRLMQSDSTGTNYYVVEVDLMDKP